MRKFLIIWSLLISFSATAEPAGSISVCSILKKAVERGTATQKLNKYLSAQWKYLMIEFPEYATYAGYPGQNDRWTDYSMAAITRHKNESKCQLEILKKIPVQDLKGEDKVNFDLAKRNLENDVEGAQFPDELLPMNQLGGLQSDLADILETMPKANIKDYENMLARLDKVPVLAEQTTTLMKEGIKKGITPTKMLISRVPAQFDKLLTGKVDDSALYKPFANLGGDFSAEQRADIQTRAKNVIQNKVYPALQKLKSFVVTDYIPKCRDSISYAELPNGKAWYAHLVKDHTTTSQTPDELHQLGLKEVARITAEMEKIRDEVKFKGDLKEFNKFLLSDKQFYYQDKQHLMIGYRDIAKRIDPELSKIFKTLPRLPYGVEEMPDYKAGDAPAAYYMPGSPEAGRPGYFEANTTDLAGRPKWGMEALTLHEAVPGHHLQISLAQELKDLPEFRKQGRYTAFTEGWGLYAEGLGSQLGMYKDPYSRYGQLTYEIWRATRLVVDTGIHAKGWSRQQAIDYFNSVMPKAKKEIENEVDRYIIWPGQALAYKVGQLKFIEMREKAKAELGSRFDIREFHDELLKHGGLPLDVLEKSVGSWIDLQKKAKAKKLRERA